MNTILSGKSKQVVIASDRPFAIIGEKINPTGFKKLAAALQEGNLDYIRELALRQVEWGADVLDVNVGVPGIDEIAMISQIVATVAGAADVPLCLDSANPEVLAAGLAAAPGKPLINSVSGEEKRLAAILPLVKERGAAVIGLTMDDSGIPPSAEGRLAIAERILERAAQQGIPAEDVIIDPLVMTVGSDSKAALVTLTAIAQIHQALGVNINLGASNVSFGLPERPAINATFLAMAMHAGATCSITDPIKLGATIRAGDLLLGRDDYAMRYIKYYRKTEALKAEAPAPSKA
jgi:5-methyltetrahydrofolate--homocysteine methyltransferase